jgi:hypothetical protein
VGGNYSWTTIFETLGKVQGKEYDVNYKPVDEARAPQKKVEFDLVLRLLYVLISAQAIETGDVDLELACSHQVIQGTGRTLVPLPYGNDKFPEIEPAGLESTFRSMFQDEEMRVILGGNALFSGVI